MQQTERPAILRLPRFRPLRGNTDVRQPEIASVAPRELAMAIYNHVDHLLTPFNISDRRYLPQDDVGFFAERVAAHMLHHVDPHASVIVSDFLPVPLTFQENNDVAYEQSLDDAAGKVSEVLFTQARKFRKYDQLVKSVHNVINGKKARNIYLDSIDATWEVNKILRENLNLGEK